MCQVLGSNPQHHCCNNNTKTSHPSPRDPRSINGRVRERGESILFRKAAKHRFSLSPPPFPTVPDLHKTVLHMEGFSTRLSPTAHRSTNRVIVFGGRNLSEISHQGLLHRGICFWADRVELVKDIKNGCGPSSVNY